VIDSDTGSADRTSGRPRDIPDRKVAGYRPDIQGLRAIAVLMVLAFHAGLPVPGGFAGVDVFFVISGFVIAGVFLRTQAQHSRIKLGTFYWRRFRRLTPALALLVTAVVILSGVLQSPFGEQTTTARTGVGAMLLAANVVIGRSSGYFDVAAERNPLLNTWSLSVEEQFYVLLPLVFLLAYFSLRRRLSPMATAWGVTSFITATSFMLAIFTSMGHHLAYVAYIPAFFSPLTRAWEFGIGVLIALALTKHGGPTKANGIMASGGVMLLALSAFALSESTPFPGPWTLVPVIGTALLIVSGTGPASKVNRALAGKGLGFVGDRSYSIYLWHWPIIVFAVGIWGNSIGVGVAATVVSLGPALLSYRFVESPFRHWNPRSRVSAFTFVGMIVGVPLAASAALGLGASTGWGQAIWIATRAALAEGHKPCREGRCSTVDPSQVGDAPVVVVAGDSHAWHLLEAASEVARDLNQPLMDLSVPGCPLYDPNALDVVLPVPVSDSCAQSNASRMSILSTLQAGSEVIIGTGPGHWIDSRAATNLERGMQGAVEAIQATGSGVFLVLPIYEFNSSGTESANPALCSTLKLMSGECPSDVITTSISGPSPAARVGVNAVAQVTGATAVDLSQWQCPEGVCRALTRGILVYMDASHISSDFSRDLGPRLARVLSQVEGLAKPAP
jgi:peptidoglycan/LPS O-acetylase OafA/YrhL